MKKLILIDGNSLLFRAYFAMRPMVTSKGLHTQGIFAFINMLNKIIKDYEPDYMAVAFDMKEKTFRHERYEAYKAGRQQTPIELLSEIPWMHKVLDAMNIAVLEKPGFEADDIIGTLASKGSEEGLRTLVISGDKDELQLVAPNVSVLINKRGMSEFDLYDEEAMMDRYSLTPKQFIDLKGLMGDKSDNIPGVPGIGEKKGIALLKEYGSLEAVLDHADEIKGKMGENIRENSEIARLSKWLATIETDAPIDFTWEELEFTEPDMAALIDLYTELEFNSFIKKLQSEASADDSSDSAVSADPAVADGLSNIKLTGFREFITEVSEGSIVAAEAACDNDHLKKSEIICFALYSSEKNLGCIQPLTPMDSQIILNQLSSMKYRLSGCGLKKLIYSALSFADASLIPYHDITVAEYLLDPNRQKYPLDKLMLRHLGYAADEKQTGIMSDEINHRSEMLSGDDCLLRAYCSLLVMEKQSKIIDEQGLRPLFDDCEMPLIRTLCEMELEGIKCDPEILMSIGTEITDNIAVLEERIYQEAGQKFNINSPKQLAGILFEQMNIPYPKARGKNGSYSTAADILDKLKDDHSIVADVLEYRKLAKLNSTYVEGLRTFIGEDGKVRPHFMQTVAATGRLSCTDPNLQNIPIRDDYGRLIRKAFIVSSEDNVFTGSDYSQIELRILASLSGDESLISDFRNGKDIHRATASRVFEIPEEEVTALDRTRAKAVNFGVVYGMSGFGLGESLGISRSEGQKYINEYFAKHKAVKDYLDKQIEEGEKNREVRTYFGRVRQIPEFASRKFMERELAKRLAMNTPIQGTAADIIKFAMNSVSGELQKRGLRSRIILQIHDELIVEGPSSEAEEVKDLLETCMKDAADLAVELTCDIHTGKTWYDLK